jgi:hypothetical protein
MVEAEEVARVEERLKLRARKLAEQSNANAVGRNIKVRLTKSSFVEGPIQSVEFHKLVWRGMTCIALFKVMLAVGPNKVLRSVHIRRIPT